MTQKQPVYFTNLDGLRAVAALAVIFYHSAVWFSFPQGQVNEVIKFLLSFGGNGGPLGVVFFFILSGFLITYLMFAEQAEFQKINVPSFYMRRVLRIWPLYYLTLVAGFYIYPLVLSLFGSGQATSPGKLLYFLFATNFDHIYNPTPVIGILGVQWSVAVEEQFYLVWPLFFTAFNQKKFFPHLLLSLILISELFLYFNHSPKVSYYHFLSCLRYLAFGGFIGYIAYAHAGKMKQVMQSFNKWITLCIYLFSLGFLLFGTYLNEEYYTANKYIHHFLPYLFFGFVILEQNFSDHSFFKVGRSVLLNRLGKISYGLYLTHMIAIYVVMGILPGESVPVLFKVALSAVLTIMISHFSFIYFEKFFLVWKKNFSARNIEAGMYTPSGAATEPGGALEVVNAGEIKVQ